MKNTRENFSWYLNITEEHFIEIYKGLDIDIELFKRQPKDSKDLINNFLPSKLWRLNNLHTIVDKLGVEMLFNMNSAQHKVYAASIVHPRLIILKSRQQGISTFWLLSFIDDAIINQSFTVGLMAQGLDEAATLLQRVKLDWNNFPELVKSALSIQMIKDNAKELQWSNGSMLFIRTSFRSTTLQRLHISELAKIAIKNPKRALETKTGTLQAIAPGNIAVIESTAEGRTMFTDEWNKAIGNKKRIQDGYADHYTGKQFQPIFLPWFEDPDCTLELKTQLEPSITQSKYLDNMQISCGVKLTVEQTNFWLDQFEELDDKIYQEYPATPEEAFMKVNDGSYYGKLYNKLIVAKGRIRESLYDSNLEVEVVIDLGMDDTFVMFFYQAWKEEDRLIDEYTNSGEGLEHYVEVMRNTGYHITSVVCPHDIMVKELSTGKTRKARLQELGVTGIKVLRRTSEADGIERVRRNIKNTYIDKKCTYAQACYTGFTKEWDDSHGVWKKNPATTIYNHGADVFRYRAMSRFEYKEDFSKPLGMGFELTSKSINKNFDL